jgi:hypothetical protein
MKTAATLCLSLALALLLLAAPAQSQEIRMGGLEGNNAGFTGVPVTLIDWSRPANAVGAVNTASVAWQGATTPCEGIFYVRFFAIPSNALGAVVMIAERGPFRAENGINTVAINPPVNVTPEIYVGIRRNAGAESCGTPYSTFARKGGRMLFTSADFSSGALSALTPSFTLLQVQASNTPSIRASTIPAVASGPGNFGSFFRSALTLTNPSPVAIRGKLVMRKLATPGSDADPSLEFTIPANGTIHYDDVVSAMGQAGLGSLDIYTTASPAPIAAARVFNDRGTEGTNGLFEEAVPAGKTYLVSSTVLIPQDLTNFRLNVGIRTFDAVTVNITVYDAAGNQQRAFSRSYAANYFEQPVVTDFAGGAVPAGGKIVVFAFDKEFIVYGSLNDNRTNDPSMRIGLD